MDPYLDQSAASSEPLLEKNSSTWRQPTRSRKSWIIAVTIHFSLILIYTSIFFWSSNYLREQYVHGPRLTYSKRFLKQVGQHLTNEIQGPAREAIKYETQVFDHSQVFFNSTPKPLSGTPGPQLDAAWVELLQDFNIRISEEEIRRLGKLDNGITLPDGGYFGSLTVHHQLHCIWRLHSALYPKFYWADLSDEEAFLNLGHSEHCLDVLRQSILCNADTSITTMMWGTHQATPIADSSNVHECVNWDSISEWTRPRSFDPFQPGYLMHPKLGPAFADERAARIGVAVESDKKHFASDAIKEALKYTAR